MNVLNILGKATVGGSVNIEVCSPFKLHHCLTGNYDAIYHFTYNLPLFTLIVAQRLNRPSRSLIIIY